ncbi:MAG: hypothetical protein ACXQS2_01850 [Methermicoccaceae archaeon]
MSEKKKVKVVDVKGAEKNKNEERKRDTFEIAPVEDIEKMTIAEAISKGVLPTPIEMARSTEEVTEFGRQSGVLYGSALASLYSAFTRRDLPFNVRLAKGVRGAAFLMGLLISAADTFEQVRNIEESVVIKKERATRPENEQVEKLLEELERLKRENEELKKGKK